MHEAVHHCGLFSPDKQSVAVYRSSFAGAITSTTAAPPCIKRKGLNEKKRPDIDFFVSIKAVYGRIKTEQIRPAAGAHLSTCIPLWYHNEIIYQKETLTVSVNRIE